MAFQVTPVCDEIAPTLTTLCEDVASTAVALCASLNSWQSYTLSPGEKWNNVYLMWNFAE
jgi:hypothetical protein